MPTEDEMRANADSLVSVALNVADSYRGLITQMERLKDRLASAQVELQLAGQERSRMQQQVFAAEHDRDNARTAVTLLEERVAELESRLS